MQKQSKSTNGGDASACATKNRQQQQALRPEPATIPSELQPNGFCSSLRCMYKIAGKTGGAVKVRGTMMRSHKVMWIDNCNKCTVEVACNQRCAQMIVTNCSELTLIVSDSVVVASKTLRVFNCEKCIFILEDCDVRKSTVHDTVDCKFVVTNDNVLAEVYRLFFGRGCERNLVTFQNMVADRTKVEEGQNFRYEVRWTRKAPDTVASDQIKQTERVGVVSLFPLPFPIVGYLPPQKAPKQPNQDSAEALPSSSVSALPLPLDEDPDRTEFIANIPKELGKHLQVRFFPSDDVDIELGAAWAPTAFLSDLAVLEAEPRLSAAVEDMAFERERDEVDEWFTDRDAVVEKVKQVVDLIKGRGSNSDGEESAVAAPKTARGSPAEASAQYTADENSKPIPSIVIFAGAGISSSMLGDFRGGGAGSVWTSMQRSQSSTAARASGAPTPSCNVETATPTYAHYAIAELVRRGICSQVVTTNYDSLFFAAGLMPHHVVTMHGDSHTLFCPSCATETRKLKQVRSDAASSLERNHLDHRSSQRCWFCHAQLLTTIVNFGDTYSHWTTPARAEYYCRRAALAISVGNSGAVQPAVFYPSVAKDFVMVNKQATPMDYLSKVRLFTTCDAFFVELMHQLRIEVFPSSYDSRASEWPEQIALQAKHAQQRRESFQKDQEEKKA